MNPIPSAPRTAVAIHALSRQFRMRLGLVAFAGATTVTMLGASLVSMDVAHARTRLADGDRRMADVRGDNAVLAIELGIRAGPVRLDRLNASALRLQSPQPGQYLAGMAALRRYARPLPGVSAAPLLAYDLPARPARAAL